MQIVYKPNYKFKFLLKIRWNGGELKVNKLATILNQLGIEGSSNIDELVAQFYEALEWDENSVCEVFSTLDLIIWKKSAPYSYFGIEPFTIDTLLKYWLEENTVGWTKLNNFLGFKISILSLFKWNVEKGYWISLQEQFNNLVKFRGTLPSYSKRKIMLGRKFNFRKKIKAKKLSDY